MIRLSLFFLAFASCVAFSAAINPPLPTLPPQFQVTVEANILQLETTYSQVEYYDFINQKARYEIETVSSSVVIIEDLKTVSKPHLNFFNLAFQTARGIQHHQWKLC